MAKPVKKSKAVDKWKTKKKLEVIAPDIFNNVPLGPIFATDPETVIGRNVETTLSQLVNSNQHHIKVNLLVMGLQGFNALTTVKSIELSRAYVASQANPGSDVIEYVFPIKTSDNKNVRFKILMFTKQKSHSNQKKALRKIAEEIIKTAAEKQDYNHLVQETVFGKIGSQIYNKGKTIVPLGRVEVRKLELL